MMIILSAKISKRKLLIGLVAAAAAAALLIFLLNRPAREPLDTEDQPAATDAAGSNEERLAFLQQFGWELQETPEETREVRIPTEFSEVFTRYNELQQSQGYDLRDYAGKTVKRYVYAVLNYPGSTRPHFASLLVCQKKVIGGDVSGQDTGMHGFAMPQATATPAGS